MKKIAKLANWLALLAVTIWAGALWAVGYLAVPVLFHMFPDNRMMAGDIAGHMFSLVGITGIFCAAWLLIYYLAAYGRAAPRRLEFHLVIAMLALTLSMLLGLQPIMADLKAQIFPADITQSPLADRFRLLHIISSVCYLIQSLLAVVLVIRSRSPE